MKFTDKLTIYGGGMSAITLAAILTSVHQQLITVGPWVIDGMIAALGSLTFYGGFRLYVAGRKHFLVMKSLALEVQAKEQQLNLTAERHSWEMQALQAEIYVKASRIYADPNGNYPLVLPTVVDMLPEQMRGQVMIFQPGQAKGIRTPQGIQALAEQAESRRDEPVFQPLPSKIRYEEVMGQIPAGQSLLGISANGVETCDFKDLMTMLISGGSSTGKSNTVAIKLHEAMTIGRNTRMIVIDPHKNKPDSLYNKIRHYEPRFLCPVAQTDEDAIRVLRWFKGEFERRMGLSTEELENLDDILLVVDEVFALCFHRENDTLKKLIKLVSGIAGYESRGYGMYAWFLTQKVSGLKWLRDAVMTTICHKMQTMSERTLAANDDTAIARDMDNWTMPGRVVVFGLNLPVTVTQMPLKTVEGSISSSDEMEPLQPKRMFPNSSIVDFQAEQWKRTQMAPETAQEKAGNDTGELQGLDAATLKKFLSEVREKRANGTPLNTILREYGLPTGGRAHQEVKALLDEMEA